MPAADRTDLGVKSCIVKYILSAIKPLYIPYFPESPYTCVTSIQAEKQTAESCWTASQASPSSAVPQANLHQSWLIQDTAALGAN